MYHFVDLTDAQKHLRRQRLDFYSSLAQLSVLLPLIIVQLHRLVFWLKHKRQTAQALETPSSPYVKQARLGHGFEAASRFRKLSWWGGEPVEFLGVYWGTKGEVLGAGVWAAWLVMLCVVQTGDDYLHLTKRFGIVAASQLPLHYLLSMKSPYSPLQLLTRQSHESLNSIHQLLGRIITGLLWCHAILYINFYILSSLLLAKLTQFYVLCGVFAIVSFTVIGTTALKPVRDWSYRVFYVVHVSLATLLLPVLYFHVSHIRVYLYETLLIYALNVALRFLATKTLTASINPVPGTNLLDITTPLQQARNWQPGQHAYISLAGHPLLRTFRSNPFTVASVPAVDNQLRFVARVLDGNTAKLAQSKGFSTKLSLEGPYGISSHADNLLRYDRILFVAGGVGATFIVPLYRQLLGDLSPGKGSHRRQKVSFLWIARSMADVDWALPADQQDKEGFTERLRVHLTKDVDGVASSSSHADFVIGEDEQVPVDDGEQGIELEEQKTSLLSNGTGEKNPSGLAVTAGRPNLTRVVEQVFSQSNTERVAVLVCGPSGLSRALRRDVGRWVKRGRDVFFHNEEFAL